MELKVICPHQLVYKGTCRGLQLQTDAGEMGILEGHLPVFVSLDQAIMKAHLTDDQTLYMAVDGGILEYIQSKARLLTPFALVDTDLSQLHHRLDEEAEAARSKLARNKKDRLAHQRAKIQLQQAINQVNSSQNN